jgi:proteasome lid subunit RPN8/RPN11
MRQFARLSRLAGCLTSSRSWLRSCELTTPSRRSWSWRFGAVVPAPTAEQSWTKSTAIPAITVKRPSAANASLGAVAVRSTTAQVVPAAVPHVKNPIVVPASKPVKVAIATCAKAASKKMKGVPSAMKNKNEKKTQPTTRRPSVLRFTPTAWAKLLFLRDLGETEIGGFGISAKDDLLLVEDIVLVKQTCTCVHVEFDDEAVAEFFEQQVAAGRRPEEFARIWIHTHPGRSPDPSGTDEATFARVFGRSDWAVMFIIARGGQTYARLRYNAGPGMDANLPVEIEYGCTFGGTDADRWLTEYETNVCELESEPTVLTPASEVSRLFAPELADRDHGWRDAWYDYADFDHNQEEAEYGFIRDF